MCVYPTVCSSVLPQPRAAMEAQKDAFLKQTVKSYMEGNTAEVDALLSGVDKKTIKHLTEKTKELGNEAYKKQQYETAIDFYNQSLAGEKDTKNRAVLLSNRSACYLSLQDYGRALQDASECIKLDPNWHKSWYRAGRALFGMKRYEDAAKVFQACKKHSDAIKTDVDKWIKESNESAARERLIERVTVDYKRFEEIEDEDLVPSDPTLQEDQNIEFSESLSSEEKQRLQQLLSGSNTVNSAKKKGAKGQSLLFHFNPLDMFEELSEILPHKPMNQANTKQNRAKATKDEGGVKATVSIALCNYLQLKSESVAPKAIAEALNSQISVRLADAVSNVLQYLFDSSVSIDMLFLGVGTGVPIVTAARMMEAHFLKAEPEREVLGEPISSDQTDKDRKSIVPRIIGCTHLYTYATLPTLQRMLSMNQVHRHITILPKRIESIRYLPKTDDSLESALSDVSHRISMLVVDTQLLENGILAKRLLPSIRYARQQLCVEHPIVLPSRISVYIQCLSIRFPKSDSYYSLQSLEKYVWSPTFDVLSLNGEWDWKTITESQQVFCFQLDCPLDQLDESLPLRETKQLSLVCTESGRINAIVMWYGLYNATTPPASRFINTIPIMSRGKGVDTDCLPPNAHHPSIRFNHKAIVQWIDDVPIAKGDTLLLEAMHSPTRIRFRVLAPIVSPTLLRDSVMPKWQMDSLKDTLTLNIWDAFFTEMLAANQMVFRDASRSLQVLNVGCGLGMTTLQFAHSLAKVFAKDIHRPHARVHITAIDTLRSNIAASKQLIHSNSQALSETHLVCTVPTETVGWKPIALLQTLEADGEVMHATTAATVDTVSIGTPAATYTAAEKEQNVEASPVGGLGLESEPMPSDTDSRALERLHSRIAFYQRDVREVFPPKDYMNDGKTLLAIGEAYNIPLSQDVRSSLPSLPLNRFLPQKVNILIWNAFDVGLLGEGVLPLLSYAWKVLMAPNAKPKAVSHKEANEDPLSTQQSLCNKALIIPSRAKLYGICVQLGRRDVNGIDVSAWNTEKYIEGYDTIDLSEHIFEALSEPFEVFQFQFDYRSICSHKQTEQRELPVRIIASGVLNAIVYWYTLYLDDAHCLSNAPECILTPKAIEAHPFEDSATLQFIPNRTTCKQCCQMLQETTVYKEEVLFMKAKQDVSSVQFSVNTHKIKALKERRTGIPLQNPYSLQLRKKCDDIAESIAQSLVSDPLQNKLSQNRIRNASRSLTSLRGTHHVVSLLMAAECALSIAIDSGRQSQYCIDPQEAASFAQSFFM